MADPVVFDTKPVAVDLEPGEKKYWCQCGKSKSQPFCDGSHRGTEYVPVEFTVARKGRYFLCQCKRSKNPPYCDGTHKALEEG